MRFEGLDLNLLIALDAILEERSVMGASRRLHLSQPAMSAAVGRLRQYFNDEIFTISQRKLVPTPLAQSLERPTRDILLRIRANLISPPKFDPASSERRFRLVVSDYASIVLMHAVMKRVYRAAPRVCLEILPFGDRVDDQLQRGEVDFVVIPDTNLIDGHPSQHLFADEFCCVAWRGSRQIGRSISLGRYLQLGHITAQLGPIHGLSFDERALVQLGYKRRIEVIAPNFTAMAAMVIGTDRIATMHHRLAVIFARNFPLKLLRAPVRIPAFREALQWPASFHLDPALVWLREIITDVAAEVDRTPATQMKVG
ncbi:LysR family nod box-dependent transcriptional activator [Bradyrhizobium sp. AZCC 1719]|uniref:LysR family transcriptional regulator n=1 Tax=Bradyrhizobium sp. AZCC 1719 TaxID=3117028 RepID=UPI002FF33281